MSYRNSAESSILDRKVTEQQYTKERKANAQKQFSYNKLVNEHAQNDHKTSKSKPVRPPQPKVDQKEDLLIDLSPLAECLSQNSAENGSISEYNAMCILDEPIDVPTFEEECYNTASNSLSPSRRAPPPYQQPPKYSNTYDIKTDYFESDSFDTTSLPDMSNTTCVDMVSKSVLRPDPIGAEGSHKVSSIYGNVLHLESDNAPTLNSHRNVAESHSGTIPKKFDRRFLLELEKDIYKTRSANFDANSTHSYIVKQDPRKDIIVPNSILTPFLQLESNKLQNLCAADISLAAPAKKNNIDPVTESTTAALIQKMWFESTEDVHSAKPLEQLYTNQNINHNFVAVANRPLVVAKDDSASVFPCPTEGPYSSLYDAIPDQSAMYDEVAFDDYLRPHRPAPLAPLSAQQLQRRRQTYSNLASSGGVDVAEKQKIDAFLEEAGPSVTFSDAICALNAVNWDHRLAIRHYRVEELLKLGLGSRQECADALTKAGWSTEIAGSILLEKQNL